MVEIRHNYKNYEPPRWVEKSVRRLLKSLSEEHLLGIGAIVLTDSASVGKGKTNRVGGRKYKRNKCFGFYNPAWRGEPAWIQLIVDNIVRSGPRMLPFSYMRDLIVGFTLYHEIGHHLHATVGSAARGGEDSADDWAMRLLDIHERRRHWYAKYFMAIAGRLILFFSRRSPLLQDLRRRAGSHLPASPTQRESRRRRRNESRRADPTDRMKIPRL